MFRLSLASVQVAPASSDLNKPPCSFSTMVYTRFGSAPDTATPIFPSTPAGRPCARVISVHVSPPSVDLNKPLPGPPLDMVYSFRYASHIAAKTTFGLCGSIETSTAPVLEPRSSTLRHVLPPSVVLYNPRSSLGTPYLPKSATNTMSGLVGWIRIFAMASEFLNPTCVHVLPPSVDL